MLTDRTTRLKSALIALGLAVALSGLMASAAAAAKPAADCQPYGESPCLLPFPNNLFTKPDRSTQTGLRVHLPAEAMPVNTKGQRVSVVARTTATTASVPAAR